MSLEGTKFSSSFSYPTGINEAPPEEEIKNYGKEGVIVCFGELKEEIDYFNLNEEEDLIEFLEEVKSDIKDWKPFMFLALEEDSVIWIINSNSTSKYYNQVICWSHQDGIYYDSHISNLHTFFLKHLECIDSNKPIYKIFPDRKCSLCDKFIEGTDKQWKQIKSELKIK